MRITNQGKRVRILFGFFKDDDDQNIEKVFFSLGEEGRGKGRGKEGVSHPEKVLTRVSSQLSEKDSSSALLPLLTLPFILLREEKEIKDTQIDIEYSARRLF